MLDRPAKCGAFNKGKRELEIVFFDAGSRHRSAANDLAESIDASYANWNVRHLQSQRGGEDSRESFAHFQTDTAPMSTRAQRLAPARNSPGTLLPLDNGHDR